MIRLVLPKRGICAGDVLFEVDVVDALGDRLAQQQLPRFLGALPLAAVLLAAAGDDHLASGRSASSRRMFTLPAT